MSRFNPKKKVVALILAIAVGTPASAITYTGLRTASISPYNSCCAPATASLTLTTDGTLGALDPSNLTAWTIVVTDRLGTTTLDQTNSTFANYLGGALVATATEISFDFGPSTTRGVQFSNSSGYWCIETGHLCDGYGSGKGEFIRGNPPSNGSLSTFEPQTGNVVLATVLATPGVPEPEAWALLLAGFGVTGWGARSRRGQAERA